MIWNSIQWFYFRNTKQVEPNDTKIDNWWKTCITQSNLKHAILHEYVKKYLSNDTIQDVRLMQLHKIHIVHNMNCTCGYYKTKSF